MKKLKPAKCFSRETGFPVLFLHTLGLSYHNRNLEINSEVMVTVTVIPANTRFAPTLPTAYCCISFRLPVSAQSIYFPPEAEDS